MKTKLISLGFLLCRCRRLFSSCFLRHSLLGCSFGFYRSSFSWLLRLAASFSPAAAGGVIRAGKSIAHIAFLAAQEILDQREVRDMGFVHQNSYKEV